MMVEGEEQFFSIEPCCFIGMFTLVAQNRKALDNANGIAPIFQGIAAGLNYATEGIASPTREVIEDVSILVGGFEAGKLTYQSGRFIFRETTKTGIASIDSVAKGKRLGYLHDKNGIKIVKDTRLDPISSLASYKFFDNVRVHEILTSEAANHVLSPWYSKPPFLPGTKVVKFEADGKMKFVRMYTQGETSIYGQFVALYDDVVGLTAQQLKDKFDLPNLPTHLSVVKPPKGTELMNGIVKNGNFGGSGMGTQFYFTEEVDYRWFKKFKKIGE